MVGSKMYNTKKRVCTQYHIFILTVFLGEKYGLKRKKFLEVTTVEPTSLN